MNINYKLSRILVLCIAVIFILLGIAEGKFGFKINKNISTVLLFAAAALFFLGKRPNPAAENKEEEVKTESEAQTENEEQKDNKD
ncbi:MAG: hypothetical protein N2484_07210 [Clostridia bacterium]|nr:hypothetical protein [Clostridia bacterium]